MSNFFDTTIYEKQKPILRIKYKEEEKTMYYKIEHEVGRNTINNIKHNLSNKIEFVEFDSY